MANIIRSNQWLIQLDNSTSIVSDFIARYFSCAGAASTDSTSIFAFFQRFLMLSIERPGIPAESETIIS
jgi:hypothetical protein